MKKSIVFVIIGVTLSLTACGGVNIPGLSTGSVNKTTQQPAPPPDDPVERAVQVGVTSARAQKCGYYFDPQQLRANFLTVEAQRTVDPVKFKKVETAYDFSNKRVKSSIAKSDDFCSTERTKEIKASLTRYLAGDFSAVKKKETVETVGIFGNLVKEKKPETFNADTYFDPLDHRR